MSAALVIGSQGVLGSLVVRALEHAGWEVHRGARRPGTSFRLVDLNTPATLTKAFAGIDVVVNTVPHRSLAAERTVLEQGGTLLNISAVTGVARQPTVPEPHGTVVMNAGLVPGVTSLVAADVVARDAEADAIELALMLSASASSGAAGAEFVYEQLTATRRHPTSTIPFPPPTGPRRCLEIARTERGWLGAAAEGREVHTYIGFAERPLHAAILALNRIGALSGLPRAAFLRGRNAAPEEPSREHFTEWVALRRGSERVAARSVEGEGDYRATADATLVFATALVERRAAGRLPPGRFDPEDLFTLDELAAPLEAAGIRVVTR